MSLRKSLVELSFTIKHNFIKTSTTDSFSAIMTAVRIMVPGLHYSDAITNTATVPPAAAAIVHLPVTVLPVPVATSSDSAAVKATATPSATTAIPDTSGADSSLAVPSAPAAPSINSSAMDTTTVPAATAGMLVADVAPGPQPEVIAVVKVTVETVKGPPTEKTDGELNARLGVLFFPSMSVSWLTWQF